MAELKKRESGRGRQPWIPESERRKRYTIRLEPWLIKWLQDQGKGKATGLIEQAVIEKYGLTRPD